MTSERAGIGPKRVLVCGSREWDNGAAIRTALEAEVEDSYGVVVIHGDARGADRTADVVARALGLDVEKYPADWRGHGRAAGPIRNKLMLDQNIDVVLAFKDEFNWALNRGGTEHMVKIALDAGVPCFVTDRGETHQASRTPWGARPTREVTYG